MNRDEIRNILPHREPMLLVDEAHVTGENEAEGLYHVRGDEWVFAGTFSGEPRGTRRCAVRDYGADLQRNFS